VLSGILNVERWGVWSWGGREHRAFAAALPRVWDSMFAAYFRVIPLSCGGHQALVGLTECVDSAVSLREKTRDAEE
jgi:hypothetical protein